MPSGAMIWISMPALWTSKTETIFAEVCTECWTVKSLTGQCFCVE